MSRPPRNDTPGAWFHVMNRGIARRTLFEHQEDVRRYVAEVARAVERGEIEVHAFSILTTHYHLLIRSLIGRLGYAMQRIQTEYSRWFNRSRRRDGPLVRGRYAARRIDSGTYRRAVVSYIDRNPVEAGIVPRAGDYPFGSACVYEGARECAWLERGWVEAEVCRMLELPTFDPARYAEAFGRLPAALARVVEARWRFRSRTDPLEDLVGAAPRAVLEWMRCKARLADGTEPGLPVLAPETVERAVRAISRRDHAERTWRVGGRRAWDTVLAGCLRQLCGLRLIEIGARLDRSRAAVGDLLRLHARTLDIDPVYAHRAAAVVRRALDRTYGVSHLPPETGGR